MSKNITINAGPLSFNITPFGFHKFADDYYKAAENWSGRESYSPVPYFLYCRAVELGLKAYLLAKGEKLDFVKDKLGHDLVRSLKNARQNSLDDVCKTTVIEENQIELANKYYKEKGFEYFFVLNHATGLKNLPNLEILGMYTKKLLEKIKHLTDNTDV